MKRNSPDTSGRRQRFTSIQREQLLRKLDRGDSSIAAFAREHQIGYSTLCVWRRQRARRRSVAFTEVEVVASAQPEALILELGTHARLRLSSPAQLSWAATLIKHLQSPC